jgi:DNA-binding transcriptional MerR regulator
MPESPATASVSTDRSLVKIGVIAKKTGLSVQALRYYQQRGLISPKQQLESGYRLFDVRIIDRILFIQRCQGIGFTLDEILELLNLQEESNISAANVKSRVENKMHLVKEKIVELEALHASLAQLSESCTGEGLIGECPIIQELWQS